MNRVFKNGLSIRLTALGETPILLDTDRPFVLVRNPDIYLLEMIGAE